MPTIDEFRDALIFPTATELDQARQEMFNRERQQLDMQMAGVDYGPQQENQTMSVGGNIFQVSRSPNGRLQWVIPQPPTRPTNPSQVMKRRAIEKADLEKFILTGSSGLDMQMDDNDTLSVTGYDMGDTNILFTMDAEAITAQKKRTRHLKPLLTKLAKREELELRLIEEVPQREQGRSVRYIVFNNREDIDDTELVSVTKPSVRPTQIPVEDDVDEDIADDIGEDEGYPF